MSLRLHHVFAFVPSNPPLPAGLVESFRRTHPGQGTANVCFVFGDTYLELLWETDRAEITAPVLARTRLAERAHWQETDACPFGMCLMPDTAAEVLPFRTWDYAPPFLPPGMSIPVATLSDDAGQPFIFLPPVIGKPEPHQQPGLGTIIGVHLDRPGHVPPSADLRTLAALGLLTLGTGPEWRMVLKIAREGGGPPRRLSLPDGLWLD